MSCVMTYSGERELLNRAFGKVTYDALKLKLYSDDRTPQISDEASYYDEVDEGDYSEIEISPGDWTVNTTSEITTASLATQTFSFTSTVSRISGYYITNNDGSTLLFAERFTDGPYENFNESTLEITITITIGS